MPVGTRAVAEELSDKAEKATAGRLQHCVQDHKHLSGRSNTNTKPVKDNEGK